MQENHNDKHPKYFCTEESAVCPNTECEYREACIMCRDKRDDIQVVSMRGKVPQKVISLSLSQTKVVLSIIAIMLTIIGSIYAGVLSIGKIQATEAVRPIIEQVVQKEVSTQLNQRSKDTDNKLARIEQNVARIEQNVARNQQLLEMMLEDRMHFAEKN